MNFTFRLLLLLTGISLFAQSDNYNAFRNCYPIAVRPEITTGIGNNPFEEILLEARPIVYYSIYNNLRAALTKETISTGNAFYLTFQPELRVYNEDSKPVKTPSYKVLIGWQRILITDNDNFLTAGIETGHYSNGQAQSAFSTEFDSESSENRELYESFTDETNLAALLNRRSGNFSTNLSRLSLNYRINTFDDQNTPVNVHSITGTYQLYHNRFLGVANFGGYEQRDIEIYGRHRVELGYEYTAYYKNIRYTLSEELLYHFNSHPSSNPVRSESKFIAYPWNTELGFIAQLSLGRDDYNYRFLDSFTRFTVGVTWDMFTPFVIKPQNK